MKLHKNIIKQIQNTYLLYDKMIDYYDYSKCSWCNRNNCCIMNILYKENIINKYNRNNEYINAIINILREKTDVNHIYESACFIAACHLGEYLKLTPEETVKYLITCEIEDDHINSIGIGFCMCFEHNKQIPKFLLDTTSIIETE